MSVRVLPAVVAGILAIALAALLFVPFVAREYRRRGELRAGAVAMRFAAMLYVVGLITYVLVPLPPVGPGFCAAFAYVRPQWEPLASLAGLQRPTSWAEFSDLLANDAVRQFGYNVALFVPLGMLARYLFRRGVPGVLLLGFAVSLFVELTQLTGIWSLYPCPYRTFDVDDLIANTGGTLAGLVFAPLLRLVPGQRGSLDAVDPRPVTAGRRLLGMTCDLLLLWWLGLAALRGVEWAGVEWALASMGRPPGGWLESAALWFGPATFLLVVTMLGRGSTLGQHAVRLRSVSSTGHQAPIRRTALRWAVGLGGLAAAEGLLNVTPWSDWGTALAVTWCTVHAFGVTRTGGHRGISGGIAGLNVVDARSPGTRVPPGAPEAALTAES